jgi:L-fuconolactonase
MKIDSHQHYWHYQQQDFPWIDGRMPSLQYDCMPNDSAADMDRCGVDAVIAVQARSLSVETDFLLELAQDNRRVVGVVGWVDLASKELATQLDQWAHHKKLKGFRHILQDEADVVHFIDAPNFKHGITRLQQRGLVYDVLVFDHQLSLVSRLCAAHDKHWLVLDHVGKPAVRNWSGTNEVPEAWISALRELGNMPHVMCKLSGLVTETAWQNNAGVQPTDKASIFTCFDQALEAFGPMRIMFGSDWPVCQLAAPYETVYAMAQDWADSRLTASEQNAFWSGNAIRCYGLDIQAPGA